MIQIFQDIPVIATCVLICIVFYTDSLYFKIPNWLNISIFALCPLGYLFGEHMPGYKSSIIAFLFIFICVGAFYFSCKGGFGGGDWKMMSALAPWLGIVGTLNFLITMSLCGGLEIIILVLLRKYIPADSKIRKGKLELLFRRNSIPYGLAIAVAGLCEIRHVFV